MTATKPSDQARFSRKTLNIIIILTSIMILVFLNLPGSKTPQEESSEPDPIPEQESEALFGSEQNTIPANSDANENTAQLESLAIINSKELKSHHINIQSWNTRKGAKVLFVEAHEVPMLDIRLVFDAGSARDDNKPGTAMFTNAMLNEGTENYSVDDIAKHFEGLGANFSNGSYRDMAIASLRTLSDEQFRDKALSMFYEVVAKPNFPASSMERLRQQLLVALEHEKQRPGKMASKTFYQTLYGDHPYGIPKNGTQDSIKTITQADLNAFHDRYYVASNLVIAIVGDIDKQQAMAITNQVDTALPAGSPASRLPTPASLAEEEARLIEFPSTQSHVLYGSLSIKRDDPIRFPLIVGNEILGGGGFTSRLNQIIRQDNGLAYSVYSYFSPMAVNGPFIMGLQTRNDQRDQAHDLMAKTLQDFIANGPTEKELTAAKHHIINSFPLSVASNSSMVGNLGAIGFYDLPLDYLDTYLSNIEAVTIEDIKSAFAKVVSPSNMLTVVVGPKQDDEKPGDGKPDDAQLNNASNEQTAAKN